MSASLALDTALLAIPSVAIVPNPIVDPLSRRTAPLAAVAEISAGSPEEFADRLKYLVRNDEAMEFSQYCVQWLQKKRDKLIKNSFAANINGKRFGPNNIT
jgi:hypothetical protein